MRRWKKTVLISTSKSCPEEGGTCRAGQRCQPLTEDFLLGCIGSHVDNGEYKAQGAWKNFSLCYGNSKGTTSIET